MIFGARDLYGGVTNFLEILKVDTSETDYTIATLLGESSSSMYHRDFMEEDINAAEDD